MAVRNMKPDHILRVRFGCGSGDDVCRFFRLLQHACLSIIWNLYIYLQWSFADVTRGTVDFFG